MLENFPLFFLSLRSKKAGRFEKLLGFATSHSIKHVAQSVSRALRNHTLPIFLIFNGIMIEVLTRPWESVNV